MCSYFGDLLNCPLNFTCSFIIVFPSPSGKLTPKKCIGGMASLKLSKAEAVRLVRCLNCQATAYICVISVKYQEFICSYLVLKKKDLPFMSPFELCATSHTSPYLLSFLTWSWYPPLCNAINMLSGLFWVSAVFCMYTGYGDVGYYSLLTACSISLNIFRAFGVLALSLQSLSLVQVQAKFESINTFQAALQRGFISEENWSCLCA